MKTCTKCGKAQDITCFVKTKNICRPCYNLYQKEWRSKNPGKYSDYSKKWRSTHPGDQLKSCQQWQKNNPDYNRTWLNNNRSQRYFQKIKRTYGLTYDDYQKLYDSQGGACAICKQKLKLFVDHDHKTNKVRGLLCNNHNVAIGHFQDNTDYLLEAINYLKP